jgi:hypothetical protein
MRTNKMKKVTNFLWITFLILGSVSVKAQVNIGSSDTPHDGAILDLSQSNKALGLLLPRVELEDVSAFQLPGYDDAGKKESAIGMVIYNTKKTTKGAQGVTGKFVWNGKRWCALAIDGGMMSITKFNNLNSPYLGAPNHEIDADKPETSRVSIENAGCDMAGSYVFALIAGTDYAQVSPVSSINPDFSVEFNSNETGFERKAIVLVTDPCGKTGTFVFSQKPAKCESTITPDISVYFDSTLHTNGAVYACLWRLSNTTNNDKIEDHRYYWILNNTTVATGAGVTLTNTGTYLVYVDQIGCGVPGKLTVIAGSAAAPAPKHIIVNNEGIICGQNGKVKLSALNAAGSTIWWFKDGIRKGSGEFYEAAGESGAGVWFAVTADSIGNVSKESNQVVVSYQSAGASIPEPDAYVNDVSFSGGGKITLCAEGTLKLEIKNRADYVNPVFTWYANDQVLGESDGQAIYVVPSNVESIILSVKATVIGSCPSSAASSELIVDRVHTPAATVINGGATNAYICGNNPAVLNVAVQNGSKYEWFLGDVKTAIAGADTSRYDAPVAGIYSVRYQNAQGCWSRISPGIHVIQSNPVNLRWDVKPESTANYGSSETYSVLAAPNAFEYAWSSNDSSIATITPIGDGSSAIVIYGSTPKTDFVITVTARNGCGETILPSPAIHVQAGCIAVSSLVVNSAVSEIKLGESATYSVTVNTGSGPFEYQWYLNGNVVPGATGNTYTVTPAAVGSNTIYVNVKNTCTASGINSLPVTLKVNYNPDVISSIPPSGVHTIFMDQKTCLDVHKTGDTGTNSWQGDRLPLNVRPNDFSTLNGSTYNFSYKFAGSGNGYSVSNVTYMYSDPNNVVSEVIGNGTNMAVLKFKSDIVDRATGRAKGNAIKITLYAIYTISGNHYKDSVDISIQDGACGCPAKMSATTWKMDFCHVPGADYTLDPYIMRPEIYGHYLRFGKKTPAATWENQNLNAVSSSKALTWDMELENPCPRGWRVADYTELTAISTQTLNPRTPTQSQDRDGYRGQTRGYVPIVGGGYRGTGTTDGYVGTLSSVNDCHTWASDAYSADRSKNRWFERTGATLSGGNYSKNYGERVRCVSEGSAYTGN